jgi:pimeloyl-ACP methyl ester carboxylesterase
MKLTSKARPAFVFVHGAWHNNTTWRQVIAHLETRRFVAQALDLPGAGVHAKVPVTYRKRPLDLAAFASEPSPNAAVTQDERTRAVVSLIDEVGGPVILVGHSLGGLTISAVAEAIPHRVRAVVYLSAFMLPPRMPAVVMRQHETMGASLLPALFLADPAAVGAFRLDPRSEDANYRARLRTALCADLSETDFDLSLTQLHCDEPAGVAQVPSPITPARFGRVTRYYIRCLEDRAIPLAAQNFMIAGLDGALGGRTYVHSLTASHSPFYSQPEMLAQLLAGIADDSTAVSSKAAATST